MFIPLALAHATRSLSPQALLQIAPFLFDIGAVLDLLGWGQFLPCAFVQLGDGKIKRVMRRAPMRTSLMMSLPPTSRTMK